MTKIEKIHAICFVSNSNSGRLTSMSVYVLENILKIFSKDVLDNIYFLLTFSDNAYPMVCDALIEAFKINKNLKPL